MSCSTQIEVNMLIDHSCETVLISPLLADSIGLICHRLPKPKEVVMAVGKEDKTFIFEEWGKLTVISMDQAWSSQTCRAIIAPNLSFPLILGGPFLASNQLVINHGTQMCIDKKNGYDLFNPPEIKWLIIKPKPVYGPELKKLQKTVVADIKKFISTNLRLSQQFSQ